MQVGSLVKTKFTGLIGVVVKVNKRDLSFYKSHTYSIQFSDGWCEWWQDYELEVLCE